MTTNPYLTAVLIESIVIIVSLIITGIMMKMRVLERIGERKHEKDKLWRIRHNLPPAWIEDRDWEEAVSRSRRCRCR